MVDGINNKTKEHKGKLTRLLNDKFMFNKLLLLISLMGMALFCFNIFILDEKFQTMYDYKRIFVISIAIVSACAAIFSIKYREDIINRFLNISKPTLYLLAGMGISAVIANLSGFYFLKAQMDFFYFLGLVLLTICFSMIAKKSRELIYSFFVLFVILCFFSVLVGHWVTILSLNTVPTTKSLISFANPRMLNQLLIWTLIPTLYLAIVATKRKKKWLAMIPLALNFSIMFALDARGFAISGFCAIIMWAIIDKKLRSRIISISLLALVIGYIIKFVLLSPLPAYLYLQSMPGDLFVFRTDSSGRTAVWLEGIRMLSFWGHGGDTYVCNATIAARPHNSLLLVAINWGMIAALCYASLLLYGFIYVLKNHKREIRVTGITVLSGFAYSLVSGVLDSPQSQLAAVISIALYWSAIKFYSPGLPSTSPIFLRWKSLSHTMVILCSLLFIGLISYKVYLRIDNNFYEAIERPLYHPQFWLGNNCVDALPKIDVTGK